MIKKNMKIKKILKIILRKVLLYTFIVFPFILASKVLYSCFHYGVWNFNFIVVQCVSFIPFFGEYLVATYFDPILYSMEEVKYSSHLGSLLFSGGLGACIGHLFSELVPYALLMDNTDISSQGGSSSGGQGPSSSGGLNLPQGASSSGDHNDIDSLMKRINELNGKLRGNIIEYKLENYLELKKAYKDFYNKEIERVDTLLIEYSGYMNTSHQTRYAVVFNKFAKDTAAFNERYNSWNNVNDPLGINRLILDKEKFDLSSDMQVNAGNIIREAVLKSCKDQKISQEQTRAFLTSWLNVVKDRAQVKQNIFSEIDKLHGIGKSVNSSITRDGGASK